MFYVLFYLLLLVFFNIALMHKHKCRSWHSKTCYLDVVQTRLTRNSTVRISQRVTRRYSYLYYIKYLSISSSNSSTSSSNPTQILRHLFSRSWLHTMGIFARFWLRWSISPLLSCFVRSSQCRGRSRLILIILASLCSGRSRLILFILACQ